MPIDASIPLRPRVGNGLADAADAFFTSKNNVENSQLRKEQLGMQKQQLERQNKSQDIADATNQQSLEASRFQQLDAREQARTKSTIIGAAELKNYLSAGDTEGARNFLTTRKANLQKRIAAGENVDTNETDEALKLLDTDPKKLQQSADQLSKFGVQLGILHDPRAAEADLKYKAAQTNQANAQAGYYARGGAGMGPNGTKAPSGYRYTPAGDLEKIPGGPAASKPIPPTALKMQNEGLEVIGTMAGINSDLQNIETQIDQGKLKLGLLDNAASKAQNKVGLGNENSRNFASFKATLEKQRNDSLRLNKGVQTEGDATRAWNELFDNINDTGVVKQRLGEIRAINARGADLQKMNVDQVRANYGAEPLDYSGYENRPAAVGNNGAQPAAQAPSGGIKFLGFE